MGRWAWRGAVLWLLGWGGSLVHTGTAAAQGREPQLPWRPFVLRDVNGWIDLEYEYDEETRRGASEVTEQEHLFTEGVQVNTRSYIYHPDLVDLQIDAGLEGQQFRRESSPSNAGFADENAVLDSFRIDAVVLQRKIVSSHLFYNRQAEDREPTNQRSFSLDTENLGADIRYHHPTFPSVLAVRRRTVEGLRGDQSDEEDFTAQLDVDNTYRELDSHLRLSFEDEEDYFRSISTETQTADLRQTLRFGSQLQHTWRNDLYYIDQSGTVQRTDSRAREEVVYELNEVLRSRTNASYQRVKLASDEVETVTARTQLEHQWYDSLRSIGRIEYNETTSKTTDTSTSAAALDFQYRKRIPGGRLSATLLLRASETDESSPTQQQTVVDESHTFGPGTTLLLDSPGILAGTVLITDPTGLIIYVEGIDYVLTPRGDLTEVRNLLVGIPLNGGILVDYTFSRPPVLEYESWTVSPTARVDLWDTIALYARYLRDDRTITKGVGDSRVDDITDTVLGAEFIRYGATATGEYELYDSGLQSFERRFAELRYDQTVFGGWQASGNLSWTRTSYVEPRESVTTWWMQAGLEGRPYRNLRAELFAWLRMERGRAGDADTDDLGVRGELEWHVGQLRARLKVEHTFEDRAARERERDTVSIEVRRWF